MSRVQVPATESPVAGDAEFVEHAPPPPARSVRRATSRRASRRRKEARARQGDVRSSVIDFLARHPGSTVGDLSKGLNLNPEKAAARLIELARMGQIRKSSRGYRMTQL
jgi:hypothetical protein